MEIRRETRQDLGSPEVVVRRGVAVLVEGADGMLGIVAPAVTLFTVENVN